MKIEHKQITIGSRVRLIEDIEMIYHTYTKGHEFNVIGSSYRGWDLKDDDGNEMSECLFIHDKLELVDELLPNDIRYTAEDLKTAFNDSRLYSAIENSDYCPRTFVNFKQWFLHFNKKK